MSHPTPNPEMLSEGRRAMQARLDDAVLRGIVPLERLRTFHMGIWAGCAESLERVARWLDLLEERATATTGQARSE